LRDLLLCGVVFSTVTTAKEGKIGVVTLLLFNHRFHLRTHLGDASGKLFDAIG
jgi:hypothetical protein